jgi:hypothetical protein
VATATERQDQLVEVRTLIPRSARDKLDRRADEDGLARSTYLRRLVLRDLREPAK